MESRGDDGVALPVGLQDHLVRYFPGVDVIGPADCVVHVDVVCPAAVRLQDAHPDVEQLRIMARLEISEARRLSGEAHALARRGESVGDQSR